MLVLNNEVFDVVNIGKRLEKSNSLVSKEVFKNIKTKLITNNISAT